MALSTEQQQKINDRLGHESLSCPKCGVTREDDLVMLTPVTTLGDAIPAATLADSLMLRRSCPSPTCGYTDLYRASSLGLV
jgi:predicted nucleic-acid-binding Zn-ribbon protein